MNKQAFDVSVMADRAREAQSVLRVLSTDAKNAALLAIADEISARRRFILEANVDECDRLRTEKRDAAFIDRMALDDARIDGICAAVRAISELPDPVGEMIEAWDRPNGLTLERRRTPIGVIAMIYESRPNVTADAAALCLKSGNAVILRGGSEALQTNLAIYEAISRGLQNSACPTSAVQIIPTSDRSIVGDLLSGLDGRIDLIIPRGGKSLVRRIQSEARAPVLSHLDGICHVYVDRHAALKKAVDIVLNAKMRRPGVCGAAETLLIDDNALESHLPSIATALFEANCEMRGDASAQSIIKDIKPATEEDWSTEYLAPIISIKAVEGVEGAIRHIVRYGSGHTDAIVTEDAAAAAKFLSEVDSAIVIHNASTQFADGGEFGFGAEIGIATGRLHARGPVGLRELTTYKNIVQGNGQIRP